MRNSLSPTAPSTPTDLSLLHDPASRWLFVEGDDGPYAISLARIEGLHLFISPHEQLRGKKELKGRLIAAGHKGIIHSTFRIVPGSNDNADERFDYVELHALPETIRIVNRREFRRLSFSTPLSCQLRSSCGEGLLGSIVDLSAGGMLLEVSQEVAPGTLLLLTVSLPISESGIFESALMVLHETKASTAEASAPRRYGCQFVTDRAISKDKALSSGMQSRIIQYINRMLIEQKKQGNIVED